MTTPISTEPLVVRAAFAVLFAAAGFAQGRVLVVDSQNRPGTNFMDLPAAEAAAADGDVLQVRDGSYRPFTTRKALSVVMDAGAAIPHTLALPQPAFQIVGLPAGRTFKLMGFRGRPRLSGTFFGDVVVGQCAGTVVLDRVEAYGGFAAAVSVSDSAGVFLNGCSVTSTGLVVTNSAVVLADCVVSGDVEYPLAHALQFDRPAVEANNASLWIAGSALTGGSRVANLGLGQSALRLVNSHADIAGDHTALVAGTDGTPVSAIDGTGSTVRIDPAVALTPSGGAPPIGPFVAATSANLPSLSAPGAPRGGTVATDLFGQPGDAYLLLLGTPGSRIPVVGLGDVWLDVAAGMTIAGTGTIPTSRHAGMTIRVPDVPILLGFSFAWQGVGGSPASGFAVSNPVAYVHD
ncbi:MAG: hypothetical protein R3F56_03000 [Planctomycetota bacterium]